MKIYFISVFLTLRLGKFVFFAALQHAEINHLIISGQFDIT